MLKYGFKDPINIEYGGKIEPYLGIDNPDFSDAPQPYKTHPRLDLYITAASSHPIEEVGRELRAMMPWIAENKLVDKTKN